MNARRAVARWAMRLFRREWRQQILVLALLTFAVGVAILGATAAYNAAPSGDGEFGSATYRMRLQGFTPEQLAARLAAARTQVGTIDVVAHWAVPVPGSVDSLDVRNQDPHGPYSGPMLALRAGRYPIGPNEVAVTKHTAALLAVHVGATLPLDGRTATVVGLVENPGKLSDDFVLVAPGSTARVQAVTILLRGTHQQAQAAAGVGGIGKPGSVSITSDATSTALIGRGSSDQKTAAALVLVLATVVLLLVALVAAAGFVVVAQRRLRQLGMMAAVGASDRHLRLVVVANGLVVGVIAAVTGTVLGILGWFAVAPRLEGAAGHRIARFDVPWWVVGAGMVLAVLTAAAAAWWPARAMARVPIVQALSARPPRPRVGGRSALVAAALIAAGFFCLSAGIDVKHDHAKPWLLIPGTIAIALGVLFASPLAIRALAATARRWPVSMRLALRDLGRHQARSGAALAAISLGVGIAVATVVIATVAQHGASEGNLSDRQLLLHIGSTSDPLITERTPAAITSMRAEIDRLAASLPGARVLELDAAIDPAGKALVSGFNDNQPATGEVVRPAVDLARQVNAHSWRGVARLYVATPQLLRYRGIDSASVSSETELLTSHVGAFSFVGTFKDTGPTAVAKMQSIDAPAFTSSPNSFITETAMRHYGWSPAPAGWLLESSRALPETAITKAREIAVANGLAVEARNGQGGLATTRTGATAAGVLLGLGILAMTVGLIRGEAAGDLRTLTATGATSSLRRALTATTAAALALLGAVLGIVGAYVALIAGYLDKLGQLSNVPIRQLTVTAVGLPLVAAAAGWLLAGREPPAVARQPLLE